MGIIQKMAAFRIIPVIQLNRVQDAVPLAEALRKGGLPAAEITFRTGAAEQAIRLINANDPDMLILAGTVLNIETAQRAMDAGAQGIVSPGTNPELVSWCMKQDIPVFPGCATPTEVDTCMRLGLDVVKLFPADIAGGMPMLKALSGPYPNMRFMPTGGITLKNVREYLALPNVLCCGGSYLAPAKLIDAGQFENISEIVSDTLTLIRK